MTKKTAIRLFEIIAFILSLSIIAAPQVSAGDDDAWFSGSYGGGGGGGGGSGSMSQSGCGKTSFSLECSGSSWIFYKYVGGDAHKNESFRFPEADNTSDDNLPVISSKCANYGTNTGFWHYGRNSSVNQWGGTGYKVRDSYNDDNHIKSDYRYEGESGKIGHWMTTTWSKITSNYSWYTGSWNRTSYQDMDTVYHKLYKIIGGDKVLMYKATSFHSDSGTTGTTNVNKAYRAAFKAKYGKPTLDDVANDMYAFCYGDQLEAEDATFSGYITATVGGASVANNGSKEVNSDSVTVVFTHHINRNNDGPDKNLTNHFYTTVSSSPAGYGTAYGTSSSKKTYSFAKNTSANVHTNSFPVNVGYGSTVKVCQNLHYQNALKDDGTEISNTSTGNYCVTITRPTGGSFAPKQSCSVDSQAEHEGDGCNRGYDVNSQTWTIKHTSEVTGNMGGTVPAGTSATSNSRYKHGNLQYGLSGQCIRSNTPYTYYWYYELGSLKSQGVTLKSTGSHDMPYNHPGENNYHFLGTYHKEKDGCKVYNKVKKTRADGSTYYVNGTCKEWNYKNVEDWGYYDSGCEGGRTTWQTFDNKKKTATYSKTNDPVLLLGPSNEKVQTDSKCTKMDVVANYSNESWSGSKSSQVCNWITRWRRHINFKQGTATIKADKGHKNKATSEPPANNVLDVSGSDANGKFTVTLTYSVDRTNTENVKDPGAGNYTVKNKWYTKETLEAKDGSGQIYKINHSQIDGTYDTYRDEGEFTSTNENTKNASGTKTHTIKGTLNYGQTIQICGKLKFGDRVKELDNNGSEIERMVEGKTNCITIKRDVRKCDTIPNTNLTLSHQSGDNIAVIGAENITIGLTSPFYTVWDYGQGRVDTASDTIASIWARPGDSIRYTVNYCMGANYAHAVHLADDRPISGGRDTTMTMSGDSTAHRDIDTAKVDEIRRSHYLFGDSVSTLSGDAATTKTKAKLFNFTREDGVNFNVDYAIKDSNFIGTKKSPSSGANTRYSCPNGGGTSSNSGYYQIAGKVINSSNSNISGCSTNRTQSLDVGRELNERLMWTNMRVATSGGVSYAINRADYASKSIVRVPYNYIAKPYLKNNSKPQGTVQIGGKMMTTPGIAVFPRKNCAFLSGFEKNNYTKPEQCTGNNSYSTYATITKPTTVTYEAYSMHGTTKNVFDSKSIVVRGNTKSYLSGSSAHPTGRGGEGGPQLDEDYIVDIPNNITPGDRVCVQMTISPADSHNDAGRAVVMGASLNYAAVENTDNKYQTFWALRDDGTTTATAVSCSTAVKRPTISAEDSNLYSASQIATSVVTRKVGEKKDENDKTVPIYRLFGSWSEYGIFGRVVTGAAATETVSHIGIASGASYGYKQSAYDHRTTAAGYNPQPLTIVTYEGGPKNGTFTYNYSRITSPNTQYNIVYKYVLGSDGKHQYVTQSKTAKTIYPSIYSFTNSPIVNAADSEGAAPDDSKICNHSTQTFANVNCTDNKIGSDKIGADSAENFYKSIIDRYGNDKMKVTKTDGASVVNGYTDITGAAAAAEQFEGSDDENSALYKNLGSGKAFLGYANGAAIDLASLAIKQNGSAEGINLGLTANSVLVYKADTIVINSNIIANADSKSGPSDFRMPIIIANKVWFTGNPTRIDAIIIAKQELNTCKWNSYSDFINNVAISWPNVSGTNNADEAGKRKMNSTRCSNELRFTAPVIVGGAGSVSNPARLILNRTYGAGGANNGGDQIRRAEIFELNPATYLWSYYEMSRYSQATTTYSRELPTRY